MFKNDSQVTQINDIEKNTPGLKSSTQSVIKFESSKID